MMELCFNLLGQASGEQAAVQVSQEIVTAVGEDSNKQYLGMQVCNSHYVASFLNFRTKSIGNVENTTGRVQLPKYNNFS